MVLRGRVLTPSLGTRPTSFARRFDMKSSLTNGGNAGVSDVNQFPVTEDSFRAVPSSFSPNVEAKRLPFGGDKTAEQKWLSSLYVVQPFGFEEAAWRVNAKFISRPILRSRGANHGDGEPSRAAVPVQRSPGDR